MNRDRLAILTLIILLAATSRLLPHPPNVTPMAAIALFAGAFFDRKWMAFVIPMIAMLISDALIGFYSQMWVIYVAFASVVCIGFALREHKSIINILSMVLAASVVFYTVTNVTVWAFYNVYPAGLTGLVQSFTVAMPFFRNALLGDLFYASILFGGFILAERKFTLLRISPA